MIKKFRKLLPNIYSLKSDSHGDDDYRNMCKDFSHLHRKPFVLE